MSCHLQFTEQICQAALNKRSHASLTWQGSVCFEEQPLDEWQCRDCHRFRRWNRSILIKLRYSCWIVALFNEEVVIFIRMVWCLVIWCCLLHCSQVLLDEPRPLPRQESKHRRQIWLRVLPRTRFSFATFYFAFHIHVRHNHNRINTDRT